MASFYHCFLNYLLVLLLKILRPFYFSPVNLVDSYENRFAFACAFGATTTKCISILFFGDYTQIFSPDMVAWIERPEVPSFLASKHVIFCFQGGEYTITPGYYSLFGFALLRLVIG